VERADRSSSLSKNDFLKFSETKIRRAKFAMDEFGAHKNDRFFRFGVLHPSSFHSMNAVAYRLGSPGKGNLRKRGQSCRDGGPGGL
jgi:hypothetical protein